MPTKGNCICVKCEIELRPKKNGVFLEETRHYDLPYKIWHADLLECPSCGFQIITGFGRDPSAEHFEDKYEVLKARVEFYCREHRLPTFDDVRGILEDSGDSPTNT